MKKICFIAQFPPPMHGLSKAVDTLYNSELNVDVSESGCFEFEKADLTDNRKFLSNLSIIRKSNADLFYFTISQTRGGNLRDLIIFRLLAKQKKKCLIHLHGGYYRQLVDNDMPSWQRKANYKAIKQVDGVIVLSDSLKAIFQGMLPDEKIYVVNNCVDDEFMLSEAAVTEKLQKLEDKEVLHVLYLSNFIRTKGYPEVLELAKLEKERVKSGEVKRFHFDFAGKFFEEYEKQFFESYIAKNEIRDFITYHGVVGGEEKKNLLKNSDIFILPTRYPNEGQPISILEAYGNAMMVVTTDHAGIPDIVEDGVNGIVIKLDMRVENIYEKLMCVGNKELMRISKCNYKECKVKFAQGIYIKNAKGVLEKCLSM